MKRIKVCAHKSTVTEFNRVGADCYLQHHTGQNPVKDTNGVLGLVVGWDSNVHIWQWRVSVAERNGGDVDIG